MPVALRRPPSIRRTEIVTVQRAIATLALAVAMLSTAAHGHANIHQDLLRRGSQDSHRELGMATPASGHDTQASASECPSKIEPVETARRLAEVSGERLTALIDALPLDCLRRALRRGQTDDGLPLGSPARHAATFSAENMILVAGKAAELAGGYGGAADAYGFAHKLYFFLQAGYGDYSNYPQHFRSIDKDAVNQAVIPALTAFVENSHFHDQGWDHAVMRRHVVRLMDLADVEHLYFPQLTELLRRKFASKTYLSDRQRCHRGTCAAEGAWERRHIARLLAVMEDSVHGVYMSGADDLEPAMPNLIEVLVDIASHARRTRNPDDHDDGFFDAALRPLQRILAYYGSPPGGRVQRIAIGGCL